MTHLKDLLFNGRNCVYGTVIFIVLSMVCTELYAQDTTFIDPGNTSDPIENGTRAHPYDSWSDFSLQDNHVYMQLSGSGTEGEFSVIGTDGLDNVVMGVYGGSERAVFPGIIDMAQVSDLEIRDLKIASKGSLRGIRIVSSTAVVIDNCEIAYTRMGIDIDGQDLTIKNTEIYKVLLDGIWIGDSRDVLVDSCYIHHVNTGYYDNYLSGGDGIQANSTHNVQILNTFIDRSHTGNKFGIIASEQNTNWVIDGCYFSGPSLSDGRGAAIHVGAEELKVRNSFFEHSPAGVYNIVPNVTVTNCVFISNKEGVSVGGGNADIYHNTFYDNRSAIHGGTSDIKNNIIYLTSSNDAGLDGAYSDIAGNIQNIEGTAYPSGLNDDQLWITSPEWVAPQDDDYHLRSTSPAIGNGVYVGVDQDFDGRRVDQNSVDIGSFQYISGMYNERPVADYTTDTIFCSPGSNLFMDENKSRDPDGDDLKYFWTGPYLLSIDSRFDAFPVISIPEATEDTLVEITLTVMDDQYVSRNEHIYIDIDDQYPVIDGEDTVENQPPYIGDASWSVDEDANEQALVGTLLANDPDKPAQELSFEILEGNQNNTFRVESPGGYLRVADAEALDFESISEYHLQVRVEDNGAPSLSDTSQVTIVVNNINEPPVLQPEIFEYEAQEPAEGDQIGQVQAWDPEDDKISYSILSGNQYDAFHLNDSAGWLTIKNTNAFDDPADSLWHLGVKAQSFEELSDTATYTIRMILSTGVNDLRLNANGFVYPNPVDQKLYVKLKKPYNGEGQLKIYNVNGVCVRSKNIILEGQGAREPVNVAGLAPGIYFMEISFKALRFRARFLK